MFSSIRTTFNPNSVVEMSEDERVAFYGAMCAIAGADGVVTDEERDLITNSLDLATLSNARKLEIKGYATNPPTITECLDKLNKSNQTVQLSLVFCLINIAWADQALQRKETEILRQVKNELKISDKRFSAIEAYFQEISTLQNFPDQNETAKEFESALSKLKSAGVPIAAVNIGQSSYSEQNFREKIRKYAKIAGKEVIQKALELFYASQNPKFPIAQKVLLIGALGYFIAPLDIIPDMLPFGFTDDLAALGKAAMTLADYIDNDVKEKASKKVKEFFGE